MTGKLILAFLFIITSITFSSAREVRLKWSWEVDIKGSVMYRGQLHTRGYGDITDTANVKILSASKKRNKLQFKVLFYNPTDLYLCYLVNADKDSVLMDDEFGNEYKGALIKTKNEQDNKLAPNQRKQVIITIDAPEEDVSLVNLHWGFYFARMYDNSEKCGQFQLDDYNLHNKDWDVSSLNDVE